MFKSNRFYFFVAGYSVLFGTLAFYGAEQVTGSHMRQVHIDRETEAHITAATGDKSLYQMPRLELTMQAFEGQQSHHVRLGINLEIAKDKIERFQGYEPRVSDRIVGFLGHEDVNRFEGPDGITKLRHDILPEINQASKPIVVSDIIFREFVVR
jgi:flagellar FliL protein